MGLMIRVSRRGWLWWAYADIPPEGEGMAQAGPFVSPWRDRAIKKARRWQRRRLRAIASEHTVPGASIE